MMMASQKQHRKYRLHWKSMYFFWLTLAIVFAPHKAAAGELLPVDENGDHVFPTVEKLQQQSKQEEGDRTRTSIFQLEATTTSVANAEAGTTVTTVNQGTTFEENNEFLGIPGTTQTLNGYDTALGNDPICWVGESAAAQSQLNETAVAEVQVEDSAVDQLVKTVFPNPLVENFTLLGKTEILDACPKGNRVEVTLPQESLRGERLRTLQYYNYSLRVELDLDTLDGDMIITDNGTASIALQVVVCSLGKSGFCSPFVHEQGMWFIVKVVLFLFSIFYLFASCLRPTGSYVFNSQCTRSY